MKKWYLLVCLFTIAEISFSQSGYVSMGFGGNVDMSKIATFGYDMHIQAPIRKSNWHLNWQWSLGGSSDGDLYLRAHAMTLLYKNQDYWQYVPDDDHQFGDRFWNFMFSAIFPLICPNGITRIMPPLHDRLQVAFYFNPLLADYWYDRNKIRSWTLEGGVKFFLNKTKPGTLYFNLGGARIHNTERYFNADYRNGWFVSFSLGMAFKTKNETPETK